MIDEIDALGLQAELPHSHCQLKHGSRDTSPHAAVDYLVLPVGSQNSHGEISDPGELVIAICRECQEALSDEAWDLLSRQVV